jgi:hypothetical protein
MYVLFDKLFGEWVADRDRTVSDLSDALVFPTRKEAESLMSEDDTLMTFEEAQEHVKTLQDEA